MIRSIADLVAVNAHWIATSMLDRGASAAEFRAQLRGTFGNLLGTSTATANEFYRLVGRGRLAAQALARGETLTNRQIPLIPSEQTGQRYQTFGLVTVTDPTIGTAADPFQTTLPLGRQSSEIPQLSQLERDINAAVLPERDYERRRANKYRRARERYAYIQTRRGTPTYEVIPTLVFRTS